MSYLLPQKVSKYYIITDRPNTDDLVRRLQDAGVFHINYADGSLGLSNFKTDLSEDINRKAALDSFLEQSRREGLSAVRGKKKELDSKVLKKMTYLRDRLASLKNDVSTVKSRLDAVSALEALKITDLSVFDYRIKLSVFSSTKNEKINCVRRTGVGNLFYYILTDEQKPTTTMKKIELETIFALGENLKHVKMTLLVRKRHLEKEVADILLSMKRILSTYGISISERRFALGDLIARKSAIGKMAYEDNFAVISCFVPSSYDISKMEGAHIKIIKAPFLPDEAPTIRDSKQLINDFSFLTWLYGTPSYAEADPSLTVSITFPLMFGAIVGDVGYGLVLLIGAFILQFLNGAFKKYLFWLIVLSAISSIFFGFLFGEFFGNLITIPALLFYRLENIQALLFGSAIGGSLMVLAGTLLNTADGLLNDDKKRVIGSLGWLSLAALSVIEVFSLFLLGTFNMYALALLPLGLILISIGNIIDLSGALNVFINVISFLRIAAVGLSSVMLAMLINDFGRFLLGYNIVFAVLALGILHLLNIVFDSLVAFLQSLRLEYVEFFSKFFRAGGKDYEPLRHIEEDE